MGKRIMGFCLVILVMIGSVIAIKIAMKPMGERTTYVISPKMSRALFGSTPEKFFNVYYSWYDSCEDYRKYATIDKKGNLVLSLTKEQENAMLEYEDANLEYADNLPGVEIADDYTSITITGDKPHIEKILFEELSVLFSNDMSNRQLFSGKDPSTISVTVTIIEESTNKVLYKAVWPNEPIKLSTKDWQFSGETADGSVSPNP